MILVSKEFNKNINKINAKYFSYDYERLSLKLTDLQLLINDYSTNFSNFDAQEFNEQNREQVGL